MSLNSISFFGFFFIVFILYYSICKKRQNELLLVSSVLFLLCYNPFCLALLLLVSIIAYNTADLMDKKPNSKKKYAVTATVLFLGILAVFKYANFGVNIWNRIVSLTGVQNVSLPILDLILPVGISFYTFQNIGYVWDVYKERAVVEKSLQRYLLFTCYFPKTTVGPIERAKSFMPQLKNRQREFSYDNVVSGLRIIMIGLFKKTAVADVLAPAVNMVYDNPVMYTGFPLILATMLYTFQIYCDFSGYADLAIGCSKMLGIDLMKNFHSPYFSKSIAEFWNRWHISLSSWLRDFIYIPLGGNRVNKPRHMFNTMATFVLSGLWHGASFNFLAWGGLHGVYLCVENFGKHFSGMNDRAQKKNIPGGGILKQILTFICVAFAWIFFRAESFLSAVYIVTHLFTGLNYNLSYINETADLIGFTMPVRVIALISLMVLFIIDRIEYRESVENVLALQKPYIRWAVYFLFAFYILFCKMYMAESQQFIYFQF